jgi:hypothetical protein
MSNLNPEFSPIEAESAPQSNFVAMGGSVPQIVVPADLVARSRPSGHSVPLTHAKHKLKRSRAYRNMIAACLAALVAMFGLIVAIDYSVEAGRDAGYQLVCPVLGSGKAAVRICQWQKN